jgi:hypothetical protein
MGVTNIKKLSDNGFFMLKSWETCTSDTVLRPDMFRPISAARAGRLPYDYAGLRPGTWHVQICRVLRRLTHGAVEKYR